jgi:hypothetical protein
VTTTVFLDIYHPIFLNDIGPTLQAEHLESSSLTDAHDWQESFLKAAMIVPI